MNGEVAVIIHAQQTSGKLGGDKVRSNWKVYLHAVLIAGFLISGCTSESRAQERINDKDLEALMRNLKDDVKSFRPAFNSALHKSTIRKTSREKDAQNLSAQFEKQTEAMLNRFRDSKKADSELSTARSTAQQIDSLIVQLNPAPQTTSRWSKIQAELQQISSAFGIQSSTSAYDNPRGITPYAQSSTNAPACNAAVGEERARRLVDECLAVSPATRPPCNAQNSCVLIIDEIKRGCALLRDRAPAFCSEYR